MEAIPQSRQKIIRYMDLSKFVWLLSRRALWFTRADQFEDPWEVFCTVTPHTFDTETPLGHLNNAAASYACSELYEARKHTFVSSWSLADAESNLMWRSYGSAGSAVAVESTAERMRISFCDAARRGDIESRAVEYHTEAELIDRLRSIFNFNKQVSVGPTRFLRPAFLKRHYFAQEREWRAAFYESPVDEAVRGIAVPVDPVVLIAGVIVSPIADAHFQEAVDSVLNKWGLPVTSRRSGLTSTPPVDPALKPLPG